ncbi:Hypothetical protein PHPALM_11613 [Phytophthora palmivora]|uniref:Uncharacterized protein n=1 Tax=Phytophthora palmivora TaxID=4796 RepID=A0A2P4Y1T3_9STRA|nr:Hypothetical protein PHPALM_11613 [Phytophthora palmivora]
MMAPVKHKKIAVITLMKNVPTLSTVLRGCLYVPHTRCEYDRAGEVDYNFVIPKKLVIKLKAVVEAEHLKSKNTMHLNHGQSGEHSEGMAFFPGAMCEPILSYLMMILIPLPDLVFGKFQQMKHDIVNVLSKFHFGLVSGQGMVTVADLVDIVVRDRMLSDVILNFGIRCICESIDACNTLDICTNNLLLSTPQIPVSTYNYLVMSVHLNDIRRGVIIVDLAYQTRALTVIPYIYEPVRSTAYNSTVLFIFKSTVTGFLK